MNILVTGAAGFIGSQLAYRLWKHGHHVTWLDNFSYGSADNLQFEDHDFSGEIITADVRDRKEIGKLLETEKTDVIYHIAGIAPLPDCQCSPQEAIDVNVTGTVNILENARNSGVKKIVFASTNALYENEKKYPTSENNFVLPTLIYPNTKYAAERFCESYCRTYGMNVTCLRFANVYGPHIDCLRKQPPFVGYMIRELYYGRVPVFHSDGNQRRDYIYVEDLIDLAVCVLEHGGFDCVNVSSGKNYSVNELYSIVSEIMKKHITPKYRSSAEYWNKYPELYGGIYPIRPEILEREVNKCTRCDNGYAFREYGWSPAVTMEEGLRKVIQYETVMLKKLDEESSDDK